MEKSEQRFFIKFFDLKSLVPKAIHTELITVLGATAYSLRQIKKWLPVPGGAKCPAKTNRD
jgi:predicted naringenin-chalcone synthase